MDYIEEYSELIYENVKLLGFEPYIQKINAKFTFDRNLFVKPNQSAFEYVTYFLLNLLNPKDCQTRFRDCFPAVERQQQSEFRKIALESLREIAKQSDADLPPVLPIHTQSPGGESFCNMYLSFTNYVMLQIINKQEGEVLRVNHLDFNDEDNIISLMEKNLNEYEQNKEQINERQIYFQNEVKYFVNQHKSLLEDVKKIEKKYNNLFKQVKSSCGNLDLEKDNSDKVLRSFCSKVKDLCQVIDSINGKMKLSEKISANITSMEGNIDANSTCDKLEDFDFNKFKTLVQMYNDSFGNGLKVEPNLKAQLFNEQKDNYLIQIDEIEKKWENLLDQLSEFERKKRIELLKNDQIIKRKKWIQERMPDEKLELKIDLSSSNKVQNTKEIDELKKQIETPQYKPRNSFRFELIDLSTLEYIAPNGDLDDSVYLSPLKENDAK